MMQGNRTFAAVAMVLSAMALFGLIDNFMRRAAETGGLWQFHALRGLLAVVLIVPVALWLGARLRPLRPGLVALRTLFNTLAMVIYFGALGVLPIAQAVAGLFAAPVFLVLYQIVLFRERPDIERLVAVALGFWGVTLALGLRVEGLRPLDLLPLLSGAFYGASNLITRRYLAAEGTLSLLALFFAAMGVAGALGSLGLILHPLPAPPGPEGYLTRPWVWPDAWFGGMIVVQAVGSLIGVGMIIRAYQMADATVVAVFENTLLVFATLWAIVLWSEHPDARGWLGLGLILVSGVLVARRG